MNLLRIACAWLASSLALSAVHAEQTGRRPNILIIYTDDQGTLDAGCYGSEDLITPSIDRLAARGVRFMQMYAPSAICSASRAGLLTGRFPARAGMPGNASSAEGTPGMPTAEVTLAEVLRDHGYQTGHVGKWHLGYTPPTMPNGQGFVESFGHMGGCIDNYSHFFYWNGPNRHDLWHNGQHAWQDGRFFGDAMVEHCKQLIDRWRDEPFFIYWAINWPHYPLQGTARWRAEYADLPKPRRQYAAFVSSMDELIGQVLDHLEAAGLTDNTIVVFQSDHGHSVEERAFGGGGNPGPYRGAKGCLFEAGLRVPAIVSWPDELPTGDVREQLVVGCDWFPTLAAWSGAPLPDRHLDGKNIDAVIRSADAASPHESFYWQLGWGRRPQWAVRRGPWKLLGNPHDPRVPDSLDTDERLFLANLDRDQSESRNMAEEYPEVVEQLAALQAEFAASIDADESGRVTSPP